MNKNIVYKITKKFNLYNYYYYFNRSIKLLKKYNWLKEKKNIILLMAPNYGNIGDQAIHVATEKFVRNKFKEYRFVSVDFEETYKNLYSILCNCNQDDIFLLQGGGNLGNLYPEFEHVRRFCVKHISHNRIIVMPSTATYTRNSKGEKELKTSRKVFETNQNLYLLAREKYTYDYIRKNFPRCKVSLIPDMVFYLYEENEMCEERNTLVLCIRREMESKLSKDQQERLINEIVKKHPRAFIFDTIVDREISSAMRMAEVFSMLNEFRRASLVITDRMHGMIMAAITNTPCIVMESLDKKILGSYEWIKKLEYIQFVDHANENEVLDMLSKIKTESRGRQFMAMNFDKLETIIRYFHE